MSFLNINCDIEELGWSKSGKIEKIAATNIPTIEIGILNIKDVCIAVSMPTAPCDLPRINPPN